ncbi:MAG: nicotinate-nucleotide adenylyltransferase [Candidatus Omnitrophota bacterium]|nr:nicotinate-nucleotide adenylyltransferase [Candidatus Omnitrophota bacterium]
MKKRLRIGIMGGTFDPPHLGHLILAEEAVRQLRLDKVIFMPSSIPPHKKVRQNNPQLRYRMVALSCKTNPAFEASRIEIDRGSVSYSVDTLRLLKKRYGNKADLFFIIGSDWATSLNKWKNITEILRLARFAVAARPGFWVRNMKKGIVVINMPLIGISSTDIRHRVQNSASIKYLVPAAVEKFIRKNRLYK